MRQPSRTLLEANEAVQALLFKLRQLKQGLIQDLPTGRVPVASADGEREIA